jgi:putative phosphoesterase
VVIKILKDNNQSTEAKLSDFSSKIAVLSDIHGNRWALEAVLSDIKQRGIHKIINLGDSLYGPLDPYKTFKLLIENNIISVQGNEDRLIIETSEEQRKNDTLTYVKENLNSEAFIWLKNLKKISMIVDEFYICHGTPERDDEYLVEKINEQGVFLESTSSLMERLSSIEQRLILCGHSHIPRITYLTNQKLIINPGSVGLPAYYDDIPFPHVMETGSPHARFSIIFTKSDSWWIENIAVPYDWKTAAAIALKNGRPDWAKYLRNGRT